MSDALFTPFQLGPVTLKNRIVMAPMTRSKSPGGFPNEKVVAYYARRAAGEVGLIVTEGTTVARGGASNDSNVPNFHSADALAGWKQVVDAVHAAGGKIAPQLWHQGALRKQGTGPSPDAPTDSPSGLSASGKPVTDPMSDADVADTIAAFASAAASAHKLGFDAVELHGAHGYLIDQFFWDRSNVRADAFGGDLAQRTRFAADMVRAVRAATAPDYPIILRFSQWKQQDFTSRLAQSPDELARFLEPLTDAGVDAYHCSTRRFWEPEFDGSEMNLAGWTKKLTGKPTITVGSVGLKGPDFVASFGGAGSETATDFSDLERRVADGEFDLVAVGRALLSDPEWAAKVKARRFADLEPYSAAALADLV